MWLSDRRTFLASLVALGGCGFAPVYGPGGAANRLQGNVAVDAPVDRDSYLLVQRLEERLGRSNAAIYGLSLALNVKQERVAIDATNITTRFNVIGKATYAMRHLDEGKVLFSGNVDSFTGYSATGTTAATQSAQRDARERLMTILADQIITRLMAQAATLPHEAFDPRRGGLFQNARPRSDWPVDLWRRCHARGTPPSAGDRRLDRPRWR